MLTNFKLSLIKRYDETASKYDSFHINEQTPKYTATLKNQEGEEVFVTTSTLIVKPRPTPKGGPAWKS